MRNLTVVETQIVELAMGRIFRMGARPTQPGDLEEYQRCRNIVLDICEPVEYDGGFPVHREYDFGPNWIRDRRRGAQGD